MEVEEWKKYKEELLSLNFNLSSSGFLYWIYALTLYKKNFYKYDNSMESLYHQIAEDFNTSRNLVERSMRYCKQSAEETIRKRYNYNLKLSNKVVLRLICENFII